MLATLTIPLTFFVVGLRAGRRSQSLQVNPRQVESPVDDEALCTNTDVIEQLKEQLNQISVWGTGLEGQNGTEWLSPNWCEGFMDKLKQQTRKNRRNLWNIGKHGGKNNVAIEPALPFEVSKFLTNAANVSEEAKFVGKKSMKFHLSPVARAWRATVRKTLGEPIHVYHGTDEPDIAALAKSGLSRARRHHYGRGIYSTQSYQKSGSWAFKWTLRCELCGSRSPYRFGILNWWPYKTSPVDSYYKTDGAVIFSWMVQYIITYETSLMIPMEAIEKHQYFFEDALPVVDLDRLKCSNGAEAPVCGEAE
eukprot:TRINITY_DN10476_c0_g1_i1.p1 TRINITY_DN10476_c0_g1~~TRINITY_DN10476_c0_g1_i1.p1  ORF type:complete len:307 (+),score=27.80 TRINITY_DN10476_c0_g1_i1:63-983(+)